MEGLLSTGPTPSIFFKTTYNLGKVIGELLSAKAAVNGLKENACFGKIFFLYL